MNNIKYLNSVLTIIAICLILITFAITGIIPKANANSTSKQYVSLPVNSDGTINVRLKNNTVDVNIESVNGYDIYGRAVPVTTGN